MSIKNSKGYLGMRESILEVKLRKRHSVLKSLKFTGKAVVAAAQMLKFNAFPQPDMVHSC